MPQEPDNEWTQWVCISWLVSASCPSYQSGFQSSSSPLPKDPWSQPLIQFYSRAHIDSDSDHVLIVGQHCVDWFQTSLHFLLLTLLRSRYYLISQMKRPRPRRTNLLLRFTQLVESRAEIQTCGFPSSLLESTVDPRTVWGLGVTALPAVRNLSITSESAFHIHTCSWIHPTSDHVVL